MDEPRQIYKSPGRADRIGITLPEFFAKFPDDAATETRLEKQRWPHKVACPRCGSIRASQMKSRKPMPWHRKDYRKCFSVKFGAVMQSSKLDHQTWLLAVYLMMTGLKGTSSLTKW